MTVIWPVYMDSEKTCKEGRKIPLTDCVDNPNLNELYDAAQRLKLKPIQHEDAAYPGEWYKYRGRLIVESDTLTKKEMISQISQQVKIQREERSRELKNKKKKKKKGKRNKR